MCFIKTGQYKSLEADYERKVRRALGSGVIDSLSMGLNALWPAGVILEKGASWC